MTTTLRILRLLVTIVMFSSCSNDLQQRSDNQVSSLNGLAFAGFEIDENIMGKWSRSCALCHVNGEAGAPVIGDSADWRTRLDQGEETVMRNVLNGYKSMPPLGYCMACELDDFRALIGFMAGTSR